MHNSKTGLSHQSLDKKRGGVNKVHRLTCLPEHKRGRAVRENTDSGQFNNAAVGNKPLFGSSHGTAPASSGYLWSPRRIWNDAETECYRVFCTCSAIRMNHDDTKKKSAAYTWKTLTLIQPRADFPEVAKETDHQNNTFDSVATAVANGSQQQWHQWKANTIKECPIASRGGCHELLGVMENFSCIVSLIFRACKSRRCT